MAKIRINGDTSGYIEISAPAVAGSTSITLPATTGGNLLATDASGNLNVDSGTFYVDGTNDRVGIGTTSPGYKLDILPGSTGAALRVRGGTTLASLQFTDNSASAQWGTIDVTVASADLTHSSVIRFYTASSERARIDSSGRLLVGTSTARSFVTGTPNLQVEVPGNTATASIVTNRNDTVGAYLYLGKSRGTTNNSNTIVDSGDLLGAIGFTGADGTDQLRAARIEAFVDGTPGANDMPGRLVFSTTADGASSPTERVRIDNVGNTTNFCSGSYGLVTKTSSAAGTTNVFLLGQYGATSTTAGGTTSFQVYSNGNVQNTNNSYTALSDIKLKENVVDAGSQWADLKALRVRNYNLKEGQTHRQIGLIAQEVEPISPGLVYKSPDRDAEGNDLGTVTKSVNYSVLYMKAVKALQEAMERIEVLEQRLADAGIA